MDRLTKSHRSWLMARIRGKDTSPELAVRKIVWGLGYRYRLHIANLPGKPDIVITRLHKIIEVHGCFWHRHGCKLTTTPKSRTAFWNSKFQNNIERDRRVRRELRRGGWSVLTIWQCQLKNLEKTTKRIDEFLKKRP